MRIEVDVELEERHLLTRWIVAVATIAIIAAITVFAIAYFAVLAGGSSLQSQLPPVTTAIGQWAAS